MNTHEHFMPINCKLVQHDNDATDDDDDDSEDVNQLECKLLDTFKAICIKLFGQQ